MRLIRRLLLGSFIISNPVNALVFGRAWEGKKNPFDQAFTSFVQKPQMEKYVNERLPGRGAVTSFVEDHGSRSGSPAAAAHVSGAVWRWVETMLGANEGVAWNAQVLILSGITHKETQKLSQMLEEVLAGATVPSGRHLHWSTMGETSPLPALVATCCDDEKRGEGVDSGGSAFRRLPFETVVGSANSLGDGGGDGHDSHHHHTLSPVEKVEARKRMKKWVSRTLVGLGMCPFTASAEVSGSGLADLGISPAPILYGESSASSLATLLADFWLHVSEMLEKGEGECSSIVLSAPLWDEAWHEWRQNVFPALEASVLAAGLGRELGIVCFHPAYDTPPEAFLRKHRFGHMYSPRTLRRWVRDSASSFNGSDGGGRGGPGLARSLVEACNPVAVVTDSCMSEHEEGQRSRKDAKVEKEASVETAALATSAAGIGVEEEVGEEKNGSQKEESTSELNVQKEGDNADDDGEAEEKIDDGRMMGDDEVVALEGALQWAGSYQRRSPHAMINVLWSVQLEAAETKRNSENLYVRNVKKLLLKEGPVRLERAADDERSGLSRVAQQKVPVACLLLREEAAPTRRGLFAMAESSSSSGGDGGSECGNGPLPNPSPLVVKRKRRRRKKCSDVP